jgi:hypothetical protein
MDIIPPADATVKQMVRIVFQSVCTCMSYISTKIFVT